MSDGVKCENCIYYDRLNHWCYQKRDDPDPELLRECYWFRKMTNADKIRSMTDEELAEWVYRHDTMCWRDGHLSVSDYLSFLQKEVQL